MKLNRTASNWSELERNKINENWDIIEGSYNSLEGEFDNVVGTITDEVVGHLIDSAKLIWKEPVDTVEDLPTSAEVGETRMVREADPDGISYVYRYDGENWEKIQAIDVTLVNEVDRRLTAQLAETDEDLELRGFNIIKNKHLVPNVNVLSDLSEGDWTVALQQALDESPDKGRTIIIPFRIKVEETIIFPLVSNSDSELKPVTIEGLSSTRNTGVLGGVLEGVSVIEYTGDGYLFDYRLGEEKETRSTVSLIDISLHGKNIEGTRAINADKITGAKYSNVLIRNFDEGFVVNGYMYYCSMDNIKCFYNTTVGMHLKSYINGTKLEKCSFSNNDGTGLLIDYGGVADFLDSCWFESNGLALRTSNVDQLNLINTYFEKNNVTLQSAAHTTSGSTIISMIGCHFDIRSEATHGFYVTGKVDFTMINCRVNWELPLSIPMIRTYASREGVPTLISINVKYTNKPNNLLANGQVIMEVDPKGVVINSDITLNEVYAKLIEIQENITMGNNRGLIWGKTDTPTTARIADFPELETASGNVAMFRNTNTTGSLLFDILRGDGTAAYAHRFNAKTGDLFMRGGLGVGNTSVGDVSNSSKIRKMEVFDTFGASLGYIQIYSG